MTFKRKERLHLIVKRMLYRNLIHTCSFFQIRKEFRIPYIHTFSNGKSCLLGIYDKVKSIKPVLSDMCISKFSFVFIFYFINYLCLYLCNLCPQN